MSQNPHWITIITIDRAKRGPSNHKAFLTKEGKNVVRKRLRDLEILSYFKNENSYIFTAENSSEPLDRDAFNRLINQFIKNCAEKLKGKPNLKSHSFRIGFMTQLWRDTNDIEFVRQAVENLSEADMQQVKSPKDLIIQEENNLDNE